MRTIEEIRAELSQYKKYEDVPKELRKEYNEISLQIMQQKEAEIYKREQITRDIPLDRLQEICNAERDERCVVLPCGVDLMKIYNELTSVCEGDGVENYTNGYRWGHKNGQIELIRKILNISEGVNHEPEQALKGGAE